MTKLDCHRRARSPWPLTLLLFAVLLLYLGGRVVWGEPGPNTGAGSVSHSTQGGASTKTSPPPPKSEVIDEPRVHRVLQPPPCSFDAWSTLCREPSPDPPARTLGSLRALAAWMGAAEVLALVGLIWILIREKVF